MSESAGDRKTMISLAVPFDQRERLAELAARNERSLSAEVRRGIRMLLDSEADSPLRATGVRAGH